MKKDIEIQPGALAVAELVRASDRNSEDRFEFWLDLNVFFRHHSTLQIKSIFLSVSVPNTLASTNNIKLVMMDTNCCCYDVVVVSIQNLF